MHRQSDSPSRRRRTKQTCIFKIYRINYIISSPCFKRHDGSLRNWQLLENSIGEKKNRETIRILSEQAAQVAWERKGIWFIGTIKDWTSQISMFNRISTWYLINNLMRLIRNKLSLNFINNKHFYDCFVKGWTKISNIT